MDELRARLAAVEKRLAVIADDASEGRRAAGLYAMVDRDVADLSAAVRGQTTVLNALRETQIEQGRTLADHSRALTEQNAKLHTLSEHVDGLVATMASHSTALDGITRMLQVLIDREG